MLERDSRVFKQKFLHLLFGETIAMERLRMFRTEHDHRLKQHAHAVRPDRSQLMREGFENGLAVAGVVLAHAPRRITGKESYGTLPGLESALHVQRLPGALFLVFRDAIGEFAGIAEGGHIDSVGTA